MRSCWCGNVDFSSFSVKYGECQACGTLVSQNGLSEGDLLVSDDEHDFYGKQYWFDHQKNDLGFPDIQTRARHDLTERNLHWLKTLLKYRLPPADVLELGCAHGSFIALMRQAGYQGSGVEMSPWVVAFGQKTFGVPIATGPIENLGVKPGSLDAIALMDVLEHLPDPRATMSHCLDLLKLDGLLLIQTPQFKEGMRYKELVESKSPFLDQLKSDEHLYLFSERSVTEFFRLLGADHIHFESAIFAIYDMFFAVSRRPFQPNAPDQIEAALLGSSNGRITLALLDLHEKLKESENDRAARWVQIEALTRMVKESEAERAAAKNNVRTLVRKLKNKLCE